MAWGFQRISHDVDEKTGVQVFRRRLVATCDHCDDPIDDPWDTVVLMHRVEPDQEDKHFLMLIHKKCLEDCLSHHCLIDGVTLLPCLVEASMSWLAGKNDGDDALWIDVPMISKDSSSPGMSVTLLPTYYEEWFRGIRQQEMADGVA